MRTVTGNITLSLDGKISGPGGDYDMSWIVPHAGTPGSLDHMIKVTTPATTALLGRKNYEGFGGYWPSVVDDENAPEQSRRFAAWLNDVDKVVFSTTLTQTPWHNSRLADSDPVTTVKELRRHDGGDIIVLASSSIIRALLAADELDRLSITLCPELVAGGASLFDETVAAGSWTLTSSHAAESGALCLLYERTR
ncbi:MAG TPA: dihydrofolate reductase family protein [Stackebrandtia sp.]|jgi:dihydrofolate reductase|uniref:dihydrofolate reductase family protein n=1 Tax=Stackebrandtia sp. TaxID=2023065 RepID=UPI002D5DC5AA|nr:dihydrofolate reductase family protein [Stackebrandtia sp.]HZE39695.1 dihydrofolate reductase family protein [Stackebrandtia sp.]